MVTLNILLAKALFTLGLKWGIFWDIRYGSSTKILHIEIQTGKELNRLQETQIYSLSVYSIFDDILIS